MCNIETTIWVNIERELVFVLLNSNHFQLNNNGVIALMLIKVITLKPKCSAIVYCPKPQLHTFIADQHIENI